jgi:microcystin-dependent protein
VGKEAHVLTTTELPSHAHPGTTDATTVSVNNANSIIYDTGAGDYVDTVGAGSLGSGTTVAAVSTNAHAHTFRTGETGGGVAHSSIQPTLFAGNMFIFAGVRGYDSVTHPMAAKIAHPMAKIAEPEAENADEGDYEDEEYEEEEADV